MMKLSLNGDKQLIQQMERRANDQTLHSNISTQAGTNSYIKLMATAPTFSGDTKSKIKPNVVRFKNTTRFWIRFLGTKTYFAEYGRKAVRPVRAKMLRYWKGHPPSDKNKVFSKYSRPAQPTFFIKNVVQELKIMLPRIANEEVTKWLKSTK